MQSNLEILNGIVEVRVPRHLRHGFDYAIASGMAIRAGSYVNVTIGKKEVIGVVWGAGTSGLPPEKCKPIAQHYDDIPPISDAMRRFIDWVAWYNCAPVGMVLKMSMSMPKAISSPATQTVYQLANALPDGFKTTAKRDTVMQWLREHSAQPHTAKTIATAADVSNAVIKSMADGGALIQSTETTRSKAPSYCPDAPQKKPALSETQRAAAEQLCETLGQGFSATLLEGVTGSGKTEVYFEAIEHALKNNQQVVVLLPEIALSIQWLSRFEKRFGMKAAIWHSNISEGTRKQNWRDIATGHAQIIVGARSALFLPFKNLGLIVVDEEHDASFKQEEGVIYHGRDMAVARAHHEKLPIILASATPALETLYNANDGKYTHIKLTDRFGGAELPDVAIVNMLAEKLPAGQWVSNELKEAIRNAIQNGEQSLLFLNRRGYAPLVLCRTCGHRFACPDCTSWLVLHQKGKARLECHHCGYRAPAPKNCPECEKEDTLAACGPGVERLEEEVRSSFPNARVVSITSESADSREALEELITKMTHGDVDILIGTQMLAKGHHFPKLTVVGVIDADLGLKGGDLRATERTFQLLHQVSGRAGREELAGRVLLQTFQPEHPVMQALAHYDITELTALETEQREESGMPPFGRLAAIILEGMNESLLIQTAKRMGASAPQMDGLVVMGPIPAPLYRLRKKFRYRLLIKTGKNINIQKILTQWTQDIALPSSITCKIDIDPYSFL